MKSKDFDKAQKHNQVQHFLTNFCNEGGGLECRACDLFDAFRRRCHKGQIGFPARSPRSGWHAGQFYAELGLCGITMQRRTIDGQVRVWALEVEPLHVESWEEINAARYQKLRGAIRPGSSSKLRAAVTELRRADGPGPLLDVGGSMYARELIATVKCLSRPIISFTNGESLTHVVTFNNPEIGPKFISDIEALRLKGSLCHNAKVGG